MKETWVPMLCDKAKPEGFLPHSAQAEGFVTERKDEIYLQEKKVKLKETPFKKFILKRN